MNAYEDIYKKSLRCREFEPVAGDFLIKKTCMDILLSMTDISGSRVGLEVGCGSGIVSAFLSTYCDKVIATDLPDNNAETHSIGISVAENLISKLGVKNIEIIPSPAENLPFQDNTFDFVYSLSVLEHVENKIKALEEMVRVVKPNKPIIFAVPTHVQSLCAFPHLYIYIARRVIDLIYARLFNKDRSDQKTLLPKRSDLSRSGIQILGNFFENHPSFPLPMPHGNYKNIFDELMRQFPYKWEKLAEQCGAQNTESFGILFLPFNILEVLSTKFLAWAYQKTKRIHRISARPLKYLCYTLCVVARKSDIR